MTPASSGSSCLFKILSVASIASQITMHQIIRTLANAPRTSALWYPKEDECCGLFWLIHMENILIIKPPTSDSICAASVNIASEFETIPPTISTIIKKKHMATTMPSFLKALFPSTNFYWNMGSCSKIQTSSSLFFWILPTTPIKLALGCLWWPWWWWSWWWSWSWWWWSWCSRLLFSSIMSSFSLFDSAVSA